MAQTRKKIAVGRRPKATGIGLDTRADILAAARKVFAQRGFSGASVREVAGAARVNKAMIYYHFRDKADLYRAVLSNSFDVMERIWDHAVFKGNAPARRKIRKYIESFIRLEQKNEELRKILAMEFTTTGVKRDNLKWIAKQYVAKNHVALAQIFEAGMKSGELRKMDPHMAVEALIGMIIHLFIYIPFAPFIQEKKVTMSALKLGAFVTELFFNGLSAQKSAKHQIRKKEAGS